MDEEVKTVVKKAGVNLRNEIVKKIHSNIPPPNAPSTIKAKKSSKTLIDTGEMWRSVDTQVIQEDESTIDVASGIFEEEIVKYAIANEYGSVRTVTTKNKDNKDEMHQGFSVIVIPERSFMRSAYDQNIEDIYEKMATEIGQIMGEKFKK